MCVNLIPGHTYYKHSILALKPGVTHPHRGPNQQHAHGNDDSFAKVKFTIPPFYGLYDAKAYLDWEMIDDNKFSSHLVAKVIVH
jgi:hypothetical protein